MSFGAYVIGLSLLALSAYIIATPWRTRGSQSRPSWAGAAAPIGSGLLGGSMFLEQERDAAYAALADLDLDYELGKLNPGDYERTRNGLLTTAVAALKGLDEAQAMEAQVVDGKLATLVHRRRKALLTCHNCGGPLEAEDKFCCRCGEAAHGRCPKCTVRAAAEDRFCRACGTSLR